MFEWVALAVFLILLGIVLITLAALLKGGRAEAGGVVLIGPLPIVFGTSQRITALTMTLAIVLTALALLLFLTSPK
ncbi:MAG: DUF131 domain-containing protein [Pyrobaculum sp.]|jgi:uncharacterized protein (TIGR00304 family)